MHLAHASGRHSQITLICVRGHRNSLLSSLCCGRFAGLKKRKGKGRDCVSSISSSAMEVYPIDALSCWALKPCFRVCNIPVNGSYPCITESPTWIDFLSAPILRALSPPWRNMVDGAGFEPAASAMPTLRSYQTDLPAQS
jgi:hypothetical protein